MCLLYNRLTLHFTDIFFTDKQAFIKQLMKLATHKKLVQSEIFLCNYCKFIFYPVLAISISLSKIIFCICRWYRLNLIIYILK